MGRDHYERTRPPAYRNSDRYRPSPPPPPPPPPLLPPRPRMDWDAPPPPPPPPPDMYRFGDSYRPAEYPTDQRDQRDHRDFSFRSNYDAPRFSPRDDPRYSTQRDRIRSQPRRHGHGNMRDRMDRNTRIFNPSNRPIMRGAGETTPDRLIHMTEGPARFKDLDNMSESDVSMDLETTDDEDDPPSKKPRQGVAQERDDGGSVPKWSNPDPYTALPPPGETSGKKTDVVKLIRKAKLEISKETDATNAVTQNVDFISFDTEDEPAKSSSDTDDSDFNIKVRGAAPDRVVAHETAPPNGTASGFRAGSESKPTTSAGPIKFSINHTAKTTSSTTPLATLDDLPSPPLKPKPKKRKRDQPADPFGQVLPEWLPRPDSSATPWCTVDHSHTEMVSHWLHKEICDFYEFVRPQDFETKLRQDLVNRVNSALRGMFPDATVYCFGSFAAGLYLPTADMDLVLNSRTFLNGMGPRIGQNRGELYKIAKVLQNRGIAQPDSREVIWGAKVPIIKFVDRHTGLKVDISFENTTGTTANETFKRWKTQYPAMPVIVTLVKQFLLMRNMNEVFLGGIGGYTVTCLVVSLIQTHPAIQSQNMQQQYNYGELLMMFFDLYGNKFDIRNVGISVEPPSYFPKKPQSLDRIDRLCIMDPTRPDNDIAQGSHKIKEVFSTFSQAFADLSSVMNELQNTKPDLRRGRSILGKIFGGNYQSFAWQRNRLQQIHDLKTNGSVR